MPLVRAAWSVLATLAAAACTPRSAGAFPVFFNVNGTTMLTSTYGADVLLKPDAGGMAVRRAPSEVYRHALALRRHAR